MSHNVSPPFCIQGRIYRIFCHLLLIMFLCPSCTFAGCFKPPVLRGFFSSIYLRYCIGISVVLTLLLLVLLQMPVA